MNIYVGNLPYNVRDEELRKTFEPYGTVASAEVIIDRRSGRSRGYGFVQMPNDAEGAEAVRKLNGTDLQGRSLRVDESRPSDEKRTRRADEDAPPARPQPTAPAPQKAPAPSFMGFIKRLFG